MVTSAGKEPSIDGNMVTRMIHKSIRKLQIVLLQTKRHGNKIIAKHTKGSGTHTNLNKTDASKEDTKAYTHTHIWPTD